MKSPRGGLVPLLLAAALLTGCGDAFLGPAPGTDRGALFDQVWKEFDLHYSFFEVKHVNWDSLGAAYRPRAVSAASDAEFVQVMGRMLGELRDVHVSITPGGAGSTVRYVSRFETMITFFSADAAAARYVPSVRPTSGGHLRYGMAGPVTGYVQIGNFAGYDWDAEMDEAIAGLPRASSIVIDVRNNFGGTIAIAKRIAGRFADRERTYAYVKLRNGPRHGDFTPEIAQTVTPTGARRFTGPVYVLTNRRNFSSAEDFVLAMRTIPRVTIVGDTTGGASGGPIPRELPNGWTYQLSEWLEFTPDHRMFEDIGLAPDVFVRATADDAHRGVDAALERALALAAAGK